MPRILFFLPALLLPFALGACGDDDDDPGRNTGGDDSGSATEPVDAEADGEATPVVVAPEVALTNPTPTGSGLLYEDLIVGNGPQVEPGREVSLHYTGWLADGTQFDSSRERGQPLTYVVGQLALIDGWSEGVLGMRQGGKRLLQIPPDLGYGEIGRPPVIPGNSTLIFEIEVVEVVE